MNEWTRERYDQFTSELRVGLREDGVDESGVLYDVARDTLLMTPGLQDFMKNEMRVKDCVGRLVNDIC